MDNCNAVVDEFKVSAVQFFTHGPRSFSIAQNDYEALRLMPIRKWVHTAYPTLPWRGVHGPTDRLTLSEIELANRTGALGLVFHMTRHPPLTIASNIKRIFDMAGNTRGRVKLILEMVAVCPHPTLSYESPAKINRLISLLEQQGLSYHDVGICIDTAHIHASGQHVRTRAEATAYLDAIEEKRWIALVHLNGNANDPAKTCKDKHAIPLDNEDQLWGGLNYGESGCRAFVEFAVANSIDCIVEVKQHHSAHSFMEFIGRI